MFNLYKVRYSELKGESPELGYELTAPITVSGVLLFFFVLGVTSPEFGFYMWRADITVPALCALAVVVVFSFLSFIATDLGRRGLVILMTASGAGLLAVIPAALMLQSYYLSNPDVYVGEPPSTVLIGGVFAVYFLFVFWITRSRLRW